MSALVYRAGPLAELGRYDQLVLRGRAGRQAGNPGRMYTAGRLHLAALGKGRDSRESTPEGLDLQIRSEGQLNVRLRQTR